MSLVTVLHGHALNQLRTLPANTVQTCITSPPYWGLRAYGTVPQVWGAPDGCEHDWSVGARCERRDSRSPEVEAVGATTPGFSRGDRPGDTSSTFCAICGAWRGELGLEPTPQLYVEHLVSVFREVRRVLRPDGTLWLNLGDSHNNRCVARKSSHQSGKFDTPDLRKSWVELTGEGRTRMSLSNDGLKEKDLVGIPWMAAFALRDDGWYLRADNIWAKGVSGQKELTGQLRIALKKAGLTPDQVHKTLAHIEPYVGNCMPESVKDRTTKSHEYVFLLSKGKHPYCDMSEVREEYQPDSLARMERGGPTGRKAKHKYDDGGPGRQTLATNVKGGCTQSGRNRRSVWLIPPTPYKGAHFATMPMALVEPCVLAATSPQGQCVICGKPWVATRVKGEPLVEQQRASGADAQGEYHGEGTKDYAEGLAQDPSDVKRRILAGMVEKITTWGPSCGCLISGVPEVLTVPQIVLDPFGGSGTTAAVAQKLGRRAITVELNASYLPLIDQRLKG